MQYTHKELLSIQKLEYPESKIITEEQIIKLHNDNSIINSSLKALKADDLTYVCYYLPPGMYGTIDKNWCCTGIRFGRYGDYISLPNVPSRLISIITGK